MSEALASPAYLPFVPTEDAREFNEILPAAREKARLLHDVACRVHAAPSKAKTRAYQDAAAELGVAFNTVYNPVSAFLKSRDWRNLIDRKLAGSKFWMIRHPKSHPAEFITFWHDLVLSNQRAAKPAYEKLMDRLAKWRAGDANSAIPGYVIPPANCPGKRHPRQWSYKNLLRIAPSEIETIAARNGRAEAMKLLPAIFTTRKGGWVCMEYQFDDMWHDFEVIHNMQICRLLEFNAIDYYSGFLFNPGLKPRFKNSEGVNEGLTEKQFRIWAIHLLATTGWSPRGTTLQGERGTAAFRDLAPKLVHWSNGLLKIPLPGMSGAPAFIGGWAERAKGNPNAKGLKEGMGKIIHNRLASLPGQIGMNPEDKPSSAFGRDREANELIALQRHLSTPLHLTHLTFADAAFEIVKTYMEINRRTDHAMEGWIEEGLYTQEYCVDPHNDTWINIGDLPDEQRQAVAIIAGINPHSLRPRRLSPLEVIKPHLPQNIKLSPEAEADCLYDDTRRDVGVTDRHITFEDKDLGPGKFRFFAEYQDRAGFTRTIPNGEEVQLVIQPFDPDRAYLYDMRGRYLGRAQRDNSIQRSDVEAIQHKIGKKERRFKDAKLGAEFTQGLKREKQLTHNTRVLLDSIEQKILTDRGLSPGKSQPSVTEAEMEDDYSSADLAPLPVNLADDCEDLV